MNDLQEFAPGPGGHDADDPTTRPLAPQQRQHKATYSRDRERGGYIIRVLGPTPAVFAGREVPVTLMNGTEHVERLDKLIWSGVDNVGKAATGLPVALYSFEARPREKLDETPF